MVRLHVGTSVPVGSRLARAWNCVHKTASSWSSVVPDIRSRSCGDVRLVARVCRGRAGPRALGGGHLAVRVSALVEGVEVGRPFHSLPGTGLGLGQWIGNVESH
jgi:hypothetical protein